MAEICVLCGKSYKNKVTDSHIESHKITAKTFAKKVKALPAEAWAEYWANENLQRIFPEPLKARKKAWKGFKTMEDWGRARHPEWF
jgi:hypothetical protein